ncbi:hypothetical protein CTI12_AA334860 [Artemisia annua]|uniref:Uncharacterized protein n=1 Tax=Artemisia annua TaxID=35608 RepID=A0A2U1MWG0_ARTAN|nr:hypothetical protein CTI12_AA334860 [Artemisia annua]
MADMELSKPQVTDEMVEYVKAKYGDTRLESDVMSDEMYEDLCRFAKEAEVIKDTNFKGKEVDASKAQPVNTIVHKSPKPSKMVTNVVLGLVAAKVSSSNKRKHWYVPPPKDLKCPTINPPSKSSLVIFSGLLMKM